MLGLWSAAAPSAASAGGLAPVPSAGCDQEGLEPGTHRLATQHDGRVRTYQVHVPAVYDGKVPTPVLLNLHSLALGGPAHHVFTLSSQQTVKSETAGFIVIEPDGTNDPPDTPFFSWNAGDACCNPENRRDIDDVDYVMSVVQRTFDQLCIDRRRIYASGMSNGGYLSHRIACERPEQIAAIVPIVGSFSSELECESGRAVPVLQISGELDNLASRQASVDRWLDMNECSSETTIEQDGDTTCTTHSDCSDGAIVRHCVVSEGNHCFFSSVDLAIPPCENRPDGAPVAEDMAWDFAADFALRTPVPVPEPRVAALQAFAVVGALVLRRRRARNRSQGVDLR